MSPSGPTSTCLSSPHGPETWTEELRRTEQEGHGPQGSAGWAGLSLLRPGEEDSYMRVGLRAEIRTLLERAREEVFQAPWARQSLSQLHKLFRFIRKAAVGSAERSRRGWVPAPEGILGGPRSDLTPGYGFLAPALGEAPKPLPAPWGLAPHGGVGRPPSLSARGLVGDVLEPRSPCFTLAGQPREHGHDHPQASISLSIPWARN